MVEYQQNKFSLQSPNLHHVRSADINQKSADLIWCKLGDFNQDKTADQTYFVGTLGRWVKNHQKSSDVIYGCFLIYNSIYFELNLPAQNFKSGATLIFEIRSPQNAKSIHGLISNFNDHKISKYIFKLSSKSKV